MDSLLRLLPWLVGGTALIAGSLWFLNSGKLSEWFPGLFGKHTTPVRTKEDLNQPGQEIQTGICLVRDGEAIAPEISLVIDPENRITFSAPGKEGREQAMRHAEQSGKPNLLVITGMVAGQGAGKPLEFGGGSGQRFQIRDVAERHMEGNIAGTRKLHYFNSDGPELEIGADGILDLDAAPVKTRLRSLRADPGLTRGRSIEPVVKQEAPGNPTCIVLNQEGRAVYTTYTTSHADTLASRLEGQVTILVGEPDPHDPRSFRIRSIKASERKGTERETRSVVFPEEKRPALPMEEDGIHFSNPDVRQKLQELRRVVEPTHPETYSSGDEYLGHGLESIAKATLSSPTLLTR